MVIVGLLNGFTGSRIIKRFTPLTINKNDTTIASTFNQDVSDVKAWKCYTKDLVWISKGAPEEEQVHCKLC